MKGLVSSRFIALEYFFRRDNVGLEDFPLEANLLGKIFPARPICLGRFIDVLKVGLLFFYVSPYTSLFYLKRYKSFNGGISDHRSFWHVLLSLLIVLGAFSFLSERNYFVYVSMCYYESHLSHSCYV